MFADRLPSHNELNGTTIDRLYRLQPLISDIGTAVVVSVAAYLTGSIIIDFQTALPRLFARSRGRLHFSAAGRKVLSELVRPLEQDIGDPFVTGVTPTDAAAAESTEKRRELERLTRRHAQYWIFENRDLLKTRLLDLSPALHSEVDRPDAEATLRMALWPPLSVIAIYLALTTSALWLSALIFPVALAIQWITMRDRSNDALVTAIAVTRALRDVLETGALGWRSASPSASPTEPTTRT
jgi:hypothetical protein